LLQQQNVKSQKYKLWTTVPNTNIRFLISLLEQITKHFPKLTRYVNTLRSKMIAYRNYRRDKFKYQGHRIYLLTQPHGTVQRPRIFRRIPAIHA